MSAKVATTRVACNTSLGDQTITTSDLEGLTPKAAVFVVSKAIADATPVDYAGISMGFTDGANEYATSSQERHGSSTSATHRRAAMDEVIMIIDADGSILGEANFKNWTTNGVVITWGDAAPVAWLLTVIFFAGTDVTAKVDTFDVISGTLDIDTVGFEPELIFAAWHDQTVDDLAKTTSSHGWGLIANGTGGVQQGHIISYGQNGVVATTRRGGISSVSGGGSGNPSAWGYTLNFNDFDADGFSVTLTGTADTTDDVCYLAITFDGVVDVWAGSVPSPTSEEEQGVTSPGFTPQAVILIPSWHDAYDTYRVGDARAGTQGLSVFDADDEYSTSKQDEQSALDMNTQSYASAKAIDLPQDDGTAGLVANFVSFDANGWTLDYTTVDATARMVWVLAIEAEGGIAKFATITDTLGLTDTISKIGTFTRTLTDTVGLIDTITPYVYITIHPDGDISINSWTSETDTQFYDGFETGDTNEWDGVSGTPDVNTNASIGGTYGLEIPGTGSAEYAYIDWVNSTHQIYRVKFYIDDNNLVGDDGDQIYICGLYDDTTRVGFVRVYYVSVSSSWTITAFMRKDDSLYAYSPDHIFSGETLIEVEFVFADTNGYANIWLDDVSKTGITGADTGTRYPDYCRVGRNYSSPSPNSGTMYFDEFCLYDTVRPSDLYKSIDEIDTDDNDYIASPYSPSSEVYECSLENVTDPSSSDNHIIKYRYKKVGSATINLTVRLMQGAVQKASWNHNGISTSIVQAEQTLSGAEADSITDYNDLRLRFEATKV